MLNRSNKRSRRPTYSVDDEEAAVGMTAKDGETTIAGRRIERTFIEIANFMIVARAANIGS